MMLYKIPYIRPLVRFHKSSATSNHTFLTVRVIIISMSLFGFLAKFLKKALVFVLCQVGFGMTGVLAGSVAAIVQASLGAPIAAGSLFSICQGLAMGALL
ncbi:hypothetical protein GcC1_105021 [Golovinomyces cichoracearum]|uniref:Uncharacterized protein n=1 Tax=Golovinomyces cichoracearum TaxID=62708 RepID=A0A420I9K3_9PEZI|nr:hypothetical protein GcC1_105021 [Golovinomyces cichoracearum]